MPKQGKSPKKKTKEKSPQRTEESEYPAMDEETYNRLLRNTIEHTKAELEAKLKQQHKEQLKEVEDRLTKKFDDEVRELSQAWDESRGSTLQEIQPGIKKKLVPSFGDWKYLPKTSLN